MGLGSQAAGGEYVGGWISCFGRDSLDWKWNWKRFIKGWRKKKHDRMEKSEQS